MATRVLTIDTPATDSLPAVGTRRRVELPDVPQVELVLRSDSPVDVELLDAADESSAGTPSLTVPADTSYMLPVRRGEIAVTATAASQSVTLTAIRGGSMQPSVPVSGLAPWSYDWLSLTPSQDASSRLVSVERDDEGWWEGVFDLSGAADASPDAGCTFSAPLQGRRGRALSLDAEDLLVLLLEVDGVYPQVGIGALIGTSELSGQRLGVGLDCDGTDWRPVVDRASTTAATGAYDPTIRRAMLTITTNSAGAGTLRAQSANGYTADGAFVESAASLTALISHTELDSAIVHVYSLGSGSATQAVRFRPSIFAIKQAALFGMLAR